MKRFDPKRLSVHKGYLRFGRTACHRIIWIEDVGPIPKGHHIHHKDGNKFNNLLSNLECLSNSTHMSLHANERREEQSVRMSNNSEKLHEWHRSEEGRKSLSEKAAQEFKNRPIKSFRCINCQKEFQTKHGRLVKFCGDNCVMSYRNKSGKDNEERSCLICSNSFVINKYQYTKTCSKPCRAKYIGTLKRKS